MLTACVDVMPTGLSRTSQPLMSRFSRLRWDLSGPACETGRNRGSFILFVLFVRGLCGQVLLDRRCSQKLLDSFRLVESFVVAEADLRCKFQVNAACERAAQKFLVAIKRCDHLGAVASAKRHDVDRRQPQIRAHP